MRRIAKRLCPLLLTLLLLLGACAPGAFANPTPAAFTPEAAMAEPEPTPRPDPLSTPDKPIDLAGSRVQEWAVTKWATADAPGLTPESVPENMLDSVRRMLPLVECALQCRTYYDSAINPDRYRGQVTGNQNEIGNKAYLWSMMEYLLGYYGECHPDAVVSEDGESVSLPQSAMRDFLELCFADYTQGFRLPTAPPGADPSSLTYENGWYTQRCYGAGHMEWFIITDYTADYALEKPYDDAYHLTLRYLYGPEYWDVAVYLVDLTPFSQPNVFDLKWRISRIFRIDTAGDLVGTDSESDTD